MDVTSTVSDFTYNKKLSDFTIGVTSMALKGLSQIKNLLHNEVGRRLDQLFLSVDEDLSLRAKRLV